MKCTYCLKELRPGTGTMFVHKTGKLSYFCTSKCYKDAIITKKKRKVKA